MFLMVIDCIFLTTTQLESIYFSANNLGQQVTVGYTGGAWRSGNVLIPVIPGLRDVRSALHRSSVITVSGDKSCSSVQPCLVHEFRLSVNGEVDGV